MLNLTCFSFYFVCERDPLSDPQFEKQLAKTSVRVFIIYLFKVHFWKLLDTYNFYGTRFHANSNKCSSVPPPPITNRIYYPFLSTVIWKTRNGYFHSIFILYKFLAPFSFIILSLETHNKGLLLNFLRRKFEFKCIQYGLLYTFQFTSFLLVNCFNIFVVLSIH